MVVSTLCVAHRTSFAWHAQRTVAIVVGSNKELLKLLLCLRVRTGPRRYQLVKNPVKRHRRGRVPPRHHFPGCHLHHSTCEVRQEPGIGNHVAQRGDCLRQLDVHERLRERALQLRKRRISAVGRQQLVHCEEIES